MYPYLKTGSINHPKRAFDVFLILIMNEGSPSTKPVITLGFIKDNDPPDPRLEVENVRDIEGTTVQLNTFRLTASRP